MNISLQKLCLVILVSLGGVISLQAQSLPLTFEDASITYQVFGFGAADFSAIPAEVIDNPDKSGLNTSDIVVSINKPEGAQVWAGASMPLGDTIDLSGGAEFEFKVWSPRTGVPIQIKFEDTTSPPDADGNPTIIAEVSVNTTVANAWEVLTVDMSMDATNYDAGNHYNQVVVFPDFGTAGVAGGETYYFDDIQAAGTSSLAEIEALGSVSVFPNPTNQNASLQFELEKSAGVSFTILNLMGQEVASQNFGTLTAGTHKLPLNLTSFPKGLYMLVLDIEGYQAVTENLFKR